MAAVCVFCASSTRIPASYVDLAARVGTELARRGHRLVSGGGDLSMMGAVARAAPGRRPPPPRHPRGGRGGGPVWRGAGARAARAGGAHTTGVIPAALLELEVGDRDADELLVVDDMRTRKGLMDSRSDAFLTLPGGLGTLEELSEVWVARLLGLHAKPVVVLDVDGLYAPLRTQVALMVERGFVRSEAADAVVWATSVAGALDAVEAGTAAPVRLRPSPQEELEAEL